MKRRLIVLILLLWSHVWLAMAAQELRLAEQAEGTNGWRRLLQAGGIAEPAGRLNGRPVGAVRLVGHSLMDDNGPFLGLGVSYFTALWRCKHDPARLERDLAFLAQQGFNYYRMLSMVGYYPAWEGLEIAPVTFTNRAGKRVDAWPDYWLQLGRLVDLAYDRYGLRTQITIFADAQLMADPEARLNHMRKLLAHVVRGRESKIVLLEVANEAWQNGFPGQEGLDQLRQLTRDLNERTDVPVAITSNQDIADGFERTYAGSGADLATWHFSRDRGADAGWRPVYDCWDFSERPGCPPVISNEPIGPGSSVNSEKDPVRLIMAAAFAYVAKLPAYVFHCEAGVFGKTRFEETPSIGQFARLRRLLPADLPDWERNTGKESDAPFTVFAGGQPNRYGSDVPEAFDGCLRNAGSRKGNRFVCVPIGIRSGGLELEARYSLHFTAYDPVTGQVVKDGVMKAGERQRLSAGSGALLILGSRTAGEAGNGSSAAASEDWAGFRGPRGQGISRNSSSLPSTWSIDRGLAWKVPLPGPGGSSPIVSGEQIYVTCYSGYGVPGSAGGDPSALQRHVVCLRRLDGTQVWTKAVPAAQPEQAKVRDHGYASSTPAADARRVYVFFGKSGVFAFSHAGQQLWHADVGSETHGWGSATSPVLYRDLVIINAAVESESLVALDRETGKEVWRARGLKESWNTPILVPVGGGKHELVVAIVGKVLGFDPDTGEPLWSCATGIGWYMVPSLVYDREMIYCIGGRTGGALAVRAGGRGDVTQSHRAWTLSKGSNVSSPIVYQGHLYWLHENLGVACCAEVATGKLVYEERLPQAGQFYASPVLADGKLYAFTRNGRGFVLAAKPQFELLARNELNDRSSFDASPAVDGRRLLVRSDKFLYCIGPEQ